MIFILKSNIFHNHNKGDVEHTAFTKLTLIALCCAESDLRNGCLGLPPVLSR